NHAACGKLLWKTPGSIAIRGHASTRYLAPGTATRGRYRFPGSFRSPAAGRLGLQPAPADRARGGGAADRLLGAVGQAAVLDFSGRLDCAADPVRGAAAQPPTPPPWPPGRSRGGRPVGVVAVAAPARRRQIGRAHV